MENEFRVYNSDPVKEQMRRDLGTRRRIGAEEPSTAVSISIVEMLHRTNYLAIVGCDNNNNYNNIDEQKPVEGMKSISSSSSLPTMMNQSSEFAPNKVIIWDDLKGKSIIELEFRNLVLNVKLRRDKIIVVLPFKIFVYSFSPNPKKLHLFETCLNDNGVVAVSSSSDNALIAFPSPSGSSTNNSMSGWIQISDINDADSANNNIKINHSILAHNSPVAIMTFNAAGSLLATASAKGTLIRIFDCNSGKLLFELRRGLDRALIDNLVFNADSTKLLVSSRDKGTIHVFSISRKFPNGNRLSSLSFMKSLLPKYFSSEWSLHQIRLPDSFFMFKYKASFGSDGESVIAIACDGSYFKYGFKHSFDENPYTLQLSKFLLAREKKK